jgi:hypothetical protein
MNAMNERKQRRSDFSPLKRPPIHRARHVRAFGHFTSSARPLIYLPFRNPFHTSPLLAVPLTKAPYLLLFSHFLGFLAFFGPPGGGVWPFTFKQSCISPPHESPINPYQSTSVHMNPLNFENLFTKWRLPNLGAGVHLHPASSNKHRASKNGAEFLTKVVHHKTMQQGQITVSNGQRTTDY